ncbi:uncharacterized protein [Anolis sagrei]|uniref:uncharacterized protein n=1 Tax=Anolis sagrei TaxID=38937 RepID=UPI00352110D1
MNSGGQSRNGASAFGCGQRSGGSGGNGGNGRNGGNGGNGGNGRNGGNGGNGGKGGNGGEESPDMGQVAQTLQDAAKKLGDLAKTISGASQDQEPYLRQQVIYKVRELICNVSAGAGNDLDLACLLRCLKCWGAGSSE